jgi:hypothetical protein
MAEKTLQDVIERIVAEGQLTRNSGAHSIRTVKEIMREQTEETRSQTEELKNAIGKSAGATISATRSIASSATGDDNLTTGDDLEARREDQSWQSQTLKFLEEIAANTAGLGKPAPEKEKETGPTLIDIGLGAILAGGALGAVAGIVIGQLKAIETLIPGIKDLRRRLRILFKRTIPREFSRIVKSVKTSVRGVIIGLSMQFDLLKANVVEFGRRIKSFFKVDADLLKPFRGIVTAVKGYVGGIAARFQDGFKAIFEVVEKIKGLSSGKLKIPSIAPIEDGIRMVTNFFKGFGAVFSKVAGVVGKIFAPIAIVMTVFDTVTGAMEGYKEGGIIGGIKGAIKGFVNSLIMAPLDLLKDGIAWIMGKFGVDPATVDAVKGFSFTELFSKIVDSPLEMLKKGVEWITEKFFGFSLEEIMAEPFEFIKVYMATLITKPFDLLKSGIAWVAEKLGFEQFAETLNSFDVFGSVMTVFDKIQEVITNAIDFYVSMFTKAKDAITGAISSAGNAMENFIKEMLRAILPDPSKERAWYDPVALVQKAIPDSVYRYAGINPETGEMEKLEPAVPPIEVPDTTVAVKPTLDNEKLEQDLESAKRATKVSGFEADVLRSSRPGVDLDELQRNSTRKSGVEGPLVSQREGIRLDMDKTQAENAEQQQKASVIAMQSNVSQSTVNNTNVNNNSSVGIQGTSGDPLDRSWGV